VFGLPPSGLSVHGVARAIRSLTASPKLRAAAHAHNAHSVEWGEDKPREAGKGEAGKASHSLPVVAVGSIPHIYQRATFSPLGDPEADATKPHYLGRIDT